MASPQQDLKSGMGKRYLNEASRSFYKVLARPHPEQAKRVEGLPFSPEANPSSGDSPRTNPPEAERKPFDSAHFMGFAQGEGSENSATPHLNHPSRRILSLTGFTLIELLMAISLIAVVGLAVYGNFSSGFAMMKRVTRPASEENLAVFLEKLTRELQNSFPYADIPFDGENEKFTFATTVLTKPELGFDQGIGRVGYFYDDSSATIKRRQENVNQIYEEEPGLITSLLTHVSSFSVQYYSFGETESKYRWEEVWDPVIQKGKIPLAVRIELTFYDQGKEYRLSRTFAIPMGE
ncbi:MAG: prepilin-type N-terminal cleavage/methylation domain-containing protein [Candidatus Omnitrophica bacterium]|nr:prepilin-type N-terminal cleavage/methylation domain-containing protein [Candidatus Omnitrophota bacterium]